jgi:inner membrane protein
MTGRTHDLAAFTALNLIVATQPIADLTLPTAFIALGANMLGGLAPDLDQSSGKFWGSFRGGHILGRLISPMLGGHRFISHSILGVVIFAVLIRWALGLMSSFLLVNMDIVWASFMIGYVSHLIMDSLTKEGVPYLFPIPFHFGFPPFSFFRIKTGGLVEKSFIFPGLILINGYLIYSYYPQYIELIKQIIK